MTAARMMGQTSDMRRTIGVDDAAMQETISATVERVWRQHIGFPSGWTTAQIDQFVAGEADRIEMMIDELDQGNEALSASYQAEYGHPPSYLEMAGLIERERAKIREIVLETELFSQIPTSAETVEPIEAQAQAEELIRRQHHHEPDRWMHPLHRCEPSVEVMELARTLWAGQHVELRVLGQYLLQARTEDHLRLPADRDDPLFEVCTNQLDQALVAKGRSDAVYRLPTLPS